MGNFKPKVKASNFFSVREMGYLSLMAAACVVGRTMFQFIPNVQPMTDIFLIITISHGFSSGLVVCLLSILATNLYMGMGIWTIPQLISYAVIIIIVGLLAKLPLFKKSIWLQTSYAFSAGMIYGLVVSLGIYKILNLPQFLPYYLSGIPFDLAHSLGNVAFYLILAPIFMRILPKLKNRQEK
jgi:hypothetical protein